MPTKCKYDGDFCQKKADKFNQWRDAVEYAAQNKLNKVFCTSGDMFDKCPLENKTECERYQRYCFIKSQEKPKQYCPFESNLECTQINQVEEFYRQMESALANNKPTYFLTGDKCKCPCYPNNCARLLAYREKLQNSK